MLLVLIVFIPQILYSRSNPYPTLNHAWVEGWSPANAFAHDFTNADGHFSYATVNAVYYARVYTDAYYLAPVWFPLLLLGIFALFYQRQFRKAVFLVGWALLPYLFLAGIPYQNIRFPLIVFPAVAALTGIGISFLLERTQMMRRLAWALAAFVLCLGMWQTYIANRTLIGEFLDNQRRDRESIAWASAQIPEGARVYTLGLTLIMNHYTTFEVYELYYQTPESLETQWIHGEDDYLLVSVWSLRNQWQGREPDIAVRWLIDHRGLVRIDSNERYTIFRING